MVYLLLGLIVGLKGPAFLDLQQITGVGTSQGAAFFTAAAVGGVVGSLVGGALYDRFNRHIVLFVSSFLYAVTCAIIPWCSVYWSMVMMFLIHELVTGAARSGTNVEIAEEFGDEGKPFMQALHFSFSLGATVAPFVLEPFLSQEPELDTTNTSFTTSDPSFNTTAFNMTTAIAPRRPESNIHYGFLIVAILAGLSSFVFLIKFFLEKNKKGISSIRRMDAQRDHDEEEGPVRKKRILPRRLLIITLALFALFYFFLDEVEDTSPSFLALFVVKQMNWTKKYGGRLSSAFWGSYTAGRGVGIVLISFVTHAQFFTICCIVLCVSQLGLLLSATYGFGTGIWISVVGIGLAISVVFPASLTWTEKELVQLSGKLMGVIFVALSLGGLANPQIIGVTMDLYSPIWYSYVLGEKPFRSPEDTGHGRKKRKRRDTPSPEPASRPTTTTASAESQTSTPILNDSSTQTTAPELPSLSDGQTQTTLVEFKDKDKDLRAALLGKAGGILRYYKAHSNLGAD
ncbi:sodium-dependent glucose transporter 1A-like [Haliotis rufescens]|uniref:sodium-dependent glucose transporter 1A-like n=1 Tax=Haliotis rufescens TaxID=6454 RepID=UPI00201F1387|nr:sodium-dependent glucose transporter 1A-like [Haliotis rufescens]